MNPARLPSIPTLRHFIKKEGMGVPKDLVVSIHPTQYNVFQIESKSGQSDLMEVGKRLHDININLAYRKEGDRTLLISDKGWLDRKPDQW